MKRLARGCVAVVIGLMPACSSVSHRADVASLVAEVDQARLREHVLALDAIGPRPVSDAAATEATVEYMARHLRELGYEVHEEPFEVVLVSKLVAVVRPVDEPDAERTEIDVAPDLFLGGPHAMQGQTERFATEGWKVESYAVRAADKVQVCTLVNLIATRRGSRNADEVVEFSAHYDTVAYCPGADDNSSGVAALLEVARVVARAPIGRTFRLCFFGAEEVGLRGSEAHVEAIRGDADARVVGLINLDSVGFSTREPGAQREPEGVPWFLSLPDEGDFLVVAGKWSSGWLGNLFEGAIDAYAPELSYYSANRIGSFFRDAARSDHSNYWDAGIPAVLLTDTGEFRGPHYHRPSDRPEEIDFAFLESVTRATAAAVLHWAQLERVPKR